MLAKPIVNGVVIVEGKSDTAKLKSLFQVETIETGGNQISHRTLNLIQEIEKTKKIILFFDPDGTGELIRRKIASVLTNPYQQCFIDKKEMVKGSKKIGVAEAENEAIKRAFQDCYTFQPQTETISLSEYDQLPIDTKEKRLKICAFLKISYANRKQLWKRFNLMGLTKQDLEKIIENIWN